MIPILTPAEMAAVDAAAPVPVGELVERAGRHVARVAVQMLGGTYGRRVVVIAGKGNNGADGRVAARLLRARGVHVRVVDADMRPPILPPADLVVDAAYGTGFRGHWTAPEVGDAAVLAVDVPSGVDALTGAAGAGVLPADRTVTFQALKPGSVFGAGSRLAGHVDVVDIGLDVSHSRCHLVEAADVAAWWPHRRVDAHKWKGAVRVVAGSPGMTGAARLAAEAAARAGAGLVMLSVPGVEIDVRSEIVQRDVPGDRWADEALVDIARFGALVVGPGLGRREPTIESARAVIGRAPVPVVVDGDGLFAVAWTDDDTAAVFADRGRPCVLTPHDGEFRLLTGDAPGDDRVAATRQLAAELGCVVLLKGPTTVVADPTGDALVVANGDQRLGTAGSGDVLSGMIGSVLAAGADPLRGTAAAAWLHAHAASMCPAQGMLAGDVVEALPAALEDLR